MSLRVFLFLAFFLGTRVSSYAAGFRASAVEVDITPTSPQWLLGYGARQSNGVHDHILHRIATR